ncbi:glycosyltransferase family 4 protein [Pseudidiomarina sp. YC-516-91]|uniref:glycosyltransferase family 4 protein n=1 Tax=Pseudidiomarina salilacus TaxID=3384452 RepID=UPI0039851D9F
MIYLVATAVKHGKGGISTALTSIIEELDRRGEAYRVVESHTGDASRWQAFQAARKALVQAGQGDVIWLHGARWLSLLRKYALARAPRKRGAKVVLHIHGIEFMHYLAHPLGRWLLQRMINRYHGLIVLTPWWRTQIADNLSYPNDRIHVMPNTIDTSLLALTRDIPPKGRAALSELSRDINVLCMTRLETGKHVAAAIECFLHLPARYKLTVAGDGSLFTELQQLTARLGLTQRVEFLGWVPYEAKPALLQRMDLFLLPSELDSFGMGFIEAMAASLPVVGVAYGPIQDVVTDRVGILVARPEPQLLAQALLRCSAESVERSHAARQHVLAQFQPSTAVEHTLAFFKGLRQ